MRFFLSKKTYKENGIICLIKYNVIVKGASGRVLIPHYSIATDPRVIPSGKEVVINGKVYRADDTGGAVKGNVIDIYAGTNHQEAMNFAYAMDSQYANVYWN